MERVVDRRKQLLQQIPTSEYQYEPLTQNQQVLDSSTGNISLTPFTYISNPNIRKLASDQWLLSYLYIQFSCISHEHISIVNTISPMDPSTLTVVDQYLRETQPLYDHQLSDFLIPKLSKAALLLNESSRNYYHTDYVNEVELLRVTALLYYQLGKGIVR